MGCIKAIAVNTFKEAIRNRVMYNLVFFAILMVVLSYFVGEVSIGEELKVIQDMGLAAISIFGILIAIFVGIGLVYKEVDKRTIYTIASKPIQRYQFLLGKFFGLASMLFAQTLFMTFFLYVFFYLTLGSIEWQLLKAIYFIYLEILVVVSIALFFSSFSSPFLSALFCIGLFIIGHSTQELHEIGLKSKSEGLRVITRIIRYYCLDHFNIKGLVVHGVYISWNWIFQVTLYGVGLILFFLVISFVIFEKKDFK